jgi:hypothetical protein
LQPSDYPDLTGGVLDGGMAKKTPKAAPAADPNAAPKKRSKLKLALFVLAPLVLLGGGGYAGWMYFLAAPEAHAEANPHGIDPAKVAALKAESAPETTATYAFALSELLRKECGAMRVDALKTASEAEAHADGALAHRSWIAAARRFESVTEASCYRMQVEIFKAESRAGAGPTDAKAAKAPAH